MKICGVRIKGSESYRLFTIVLKMVYLILLSVEVRQS